MERDNLKTGTTLQKRSSLLNYGIIFVGCFVSLWILFTVLLGMGLDGPTSTEHGVSYSFFYGEEGTVIPPESELLIPAVIDEMGNPVFTEEELNDLAYSASYGLPYDSTYNISYKNTHYGTMISIRPDTNRSLSNVRVDFRKKQDVTGKIITLSPILKRETSVFSTFFLVSPRYTVPVFIDQRITPAKYTHMYLGLSECGYTSADPYVCRGYAQGPEGPMYTRNTGFVNIPLGEFGELNDLRTNSTFLSRPLEYFNRVISQKEISQ